MYGNDFCDLKITKGKWVDFQGRQPVIVFFVSLFALKTSKTP